MVGDLSKNVSRFECVCRCGCGRSGVDVEFLPIFQSLCNFISIKYNTNIEAIITNWFRCQEYNDSLENSVKNSKHVEGKAVDFQIILHGRVLLAREIAEVIKDKLDLCEIDFYMIDAYTVHLEYDPI